MLAGYPHGGCPGQLPEDDEETASYRPARPAVELPEDRLDTARALGLVGPLVAAPAGLCGRSLSRQWLVAATLSPWRDFVGHGSSGRQSARRYLSFVTNLRDSTLPDVAGSINSGAKRSSPFRAAVSSTARLTPQTDILTTTS
jgi:hypothetical protein